MFHSYVSYWRHMSTAQVIPSCCTMSLRSHHIPRIPTIDLCKLLMKSVRICFGLNIMYIYIYSVYIYIYSIYIIYMVLYQNRFPNSKPRRLHTNMFSLEIHLLLGMFPNSQTHPFDCSLNKEICMYIYIYIITNHTSKTIYIYMQQQYIVCI